MADRSIDLRSDTVTRPTPGMLRAMIEAPLGDDVFGEDPTVNALEREVANLLGKEAAIFVPSGTMSNQIAINVHTQPGDDLLCEASAHIHRYEAGAPAILSGVTVRTIEGRSGILDLADFEGKIHPRDHHRTRTRLVCLENTHNAGGGRVQPLENIQRISEWARGQDLRLHLDGARLMNAVVKTGISAREWAAHFDTVSMCFSKGLGAPVGSALAGQSDLIDEARFVRKRLGGGMRQAGILAAAARYALAHHVDRLAEDHENAKSIAQAIEDSGAFELRADDVETNLIWATTKQGFASAPQVVSVLLEHGIWTLPMNERTVRFVTHLDVSREDASRVAGIIRKLPAAFT